MPIKKCCQASARKKHAKVRQLINLPGKRQAEKGKSGNRFKAAAAPRAGQR